MNPSYEIQYRLKKNAPGFIKFLHGRKGRYHWKRWKRYRTAGAARTALKVLQRKAVLHDYRADDPSRLWA